VDEPEDDYEDEFEDDHQDETERPRKRRPGRPGLSEAEVQAAVDRLNAAGEKVTPENLGKVLNRSSRSARRYLKELREAETAEQETAQQSTAGMLPLSI
jgi:response regulator of citrate/malate metabolism